MLENSLGTFGFNTTALFDSLLSGVPVANLRGKIDEANFEYHFETYRKVLPEITNIADFTDWIYTIKSNNFKSLWLDLNFDSLDKYFSKIFGRHSLNENTSFTPES